MSANDFLWGVLPYIVLTIFIGGHIYRYQKDQFGWSTKSSEFLEKKRLRIGSQLFHWGIIFVFGGHVMGLIIPIGFYNALGVSEHFYHNIAIIFGVPAGIAALAGLAILSFRRVNVSRIKATTSTSDWISLTLLLLAVLTGLAATGFNIDSNGFDYRTTIAPWLRGLFVLNIQPELMATIPLGFKIHILSTFALYAVWPFTRLVHVFSFPLRYLKRNYVIYKRRVPEKHV
ncbi:respiratory nitrate reductase subunit gamma [Virgibacillus profundi]|uniref:Respiratory nitrate reductase subunit gamma n=1 Tax=Virgibacillus profundi TaxID=2024555 RepID=A0A2A2II84_9BACI|nr:respiratory nitrate reductase subunit gamma [Virgibacillus profundi]PAV30813.1 respiratory nitrate reductase subunit gamma [Virgibacillus profundi]PXY54996.1 respiratory nitrate reductase subunit gamma [Virgibacillus profundi]